jgi:hypothetical protein
MRASSHAFPSASLRAFLVALLAPFAALLSPTPQRSALAEEAAPRLPVPEPRALAALETEVRSPFPEVYAGESPAEMASLARKFLELAGRTEGAPERRFVLLREARDLASRAGDAALALAAVDAMAVRFEIEPLDMKAETLGAIAAATHESGLLTELAEHFLVLTHEGAAADDHAAAARLARQAEGLARRSGSTELSAEVRFTASEITHLQRLHSLERKARKKLLSSPDDPAANLAVGRYLSLGRGDLEGALPHLARSGGGGALALLAQADLGAPEPAAERADLADRWWGLAAREEVLSREADELPYHWAFLCQTFRARAAHWYALARPALGGVRQVEVSRRLEALAGRDSERVGVRSPKKTFRLLPRGPGFLAGLRLSTSAEDSVLRSVEPIFRTRRGRASGAAIGREKRNIVEVVARPGYAVGGRVAKGHDAAADGVDGFRLVFMRLRGDRLDPADAYESPWFGGGGGEAERMLGGSGELVLGIQGGHSKYVDALGLVLGP